MVSTWDFEKDISRRQFIGGALALAAASAVPSFIRGAYKPTQSDSLQVWTCGGLSEAFLDLNQVYTMHTGHNIQYTGDFAGALVNPCWLKRVVQKSLELVVWI